MAPEGLIGDVNAFVFEEFAHVIGACRQPKLITELRTGLDKLSDGLNGCAGTDPAGHGADAP